MESRNEKELLLASKDALKSLISMWRSDYETPGNPTPENNDKAVVRLRNIIEKIEKEKYK